MPTFKDEKVNIWNLPMENEIKINQNIAEKGNCMIWSVQ